MSTAALALAVGIVRAQPTPGAASTSAQYKIGVVNMQHLLQNSEMRKREYDKLLVKVDELQAPIDRMSDEIEAAKEKYEEERDSMTEEQRVETKLEIESDYADYQNELGKRQKRVDTMEISVRKEIFMAIEAAINTVATDGNYHLVLSANSGPTGSVLYFSPTIDITTRVMEQLNSSQ